MEIQILHAFSELKFPSLAELYFEEEKNSEAIYEKISDFYSFLRQDFFKISGSFYCVAENNGAYISALRIEPFQDGWLLSGLQTLSGHRRNGVASQLMETAIQYLNVNGGCSIYSHVSKKNHASLRTHRKFGFIPIKDYAVYLDGSIDQNAYTLLLK